MPTNELLQTVLVTGAGGRLGKLLRRANAGAEDGSARFVFQSRRPGADLLWQPGEPFDAWPQSDTLVALWGRTSGTETELAENTELAEMTDTAARACGAKRIFHMSTAAVYGEGRGLCETDPAVPAGSYGAAKLAMERKVAGFPRRRGVRHCCLRLANVIGADSLAPALIADQPVVLDRFADGGGPQRSFIAISDVLRVLSALARIPADTLPDVLNVCAPLPVTMEDVARAAGKSIVWRPAPGTAIQAVTLNQDRLAGLLPGIRFLNRPDEMISDWAKYTRRP